MGTSSYRESYSGYDEKPKSKRKKSEKTQMELIIEKMKAVEDSKRAIEEARDGLEDAEQQLDEAREELRRSEEAVMKQIDSLDPETRDMLRGMLSNMNKGSRNNRGRDEDR